MNKLFVSLLVAFLLMGTVLAACIAQTFAPTSTSGVVSTLSPQESAALTSTVDISLYADSAGRTVWDFVVLGSDFREGDPARQSEHTDAFVLVHVVETIEQAEAAEPVLSVTFVPIARELWVSYRGEEQLINGIYRKYGFEGIATVMLDTFGVPVASVVYADMESFMGFVDSLGGVKLTVREDLVDRCGDKPYNLHAGQTEVFTGFDLLCYARMRKGSEGGYFNRQLRHADILAALWTRVSEEIVYDPAGLVANVMVHPFITVWPFTEWGDLANLAIRAKEADSLSYRTVSLDQQFLQVGMETGILADRTIGEYFVQYALVNLKDWTACAVDVACDVSTLIP